MRFLALIVVVLFLSSCKEKNIPFNEDIGIYILVSDLEGNDLLDPLSPGFFNESDIKIFYLEDGISREINDPTEEYPKNFRLLEDENFHFMLLWPNSYIGDDYPITYIQWTETDTDTLKCDFWRSESGLTCTKVWYNDELVVTDYIQGRIVNVSKMRDVI